MDNINDNMYQKSMEARFLRLPQTEFEAVQQCEACGETLFPKRLTFKGEVRYGPSRCRCQEEVARRAQVEEQRKVILEAQNINTYAWLGREWRDLSLREKTFENFDQTRQQRAYEAAMQFAYDPCGTLVLHGSFGTGKTHLLAAICNAALRKSKPTSSLFATSANLFAAIQHRIGENESYLPLLQKAICAQLFCIDDIDKSKWTEFREEIYFAIIDGRTKRDLPIAISTNKLSELHDYVGGAVASRLKMGRTEVEMTGKDYREEM
jgi:DNA replication protein DnaC